MTSISSKKIQNASKSCSDKTICVERCNSMPKRTVGVVSARNCSENITNAAQCKDTTKPINNFHSCVAWIWQNVFIQLSSKVSNFAHTIDLGPLRFDSIKTNCFKDINSNSVKLERLKFTNFIGIYIMSMNSWYHKLDIFVWT